MKILIVAEDFPWPPHGGGTVRLVKVVEALSALGETDLFTLYDRRRGALSMPATVTVSRLKTVGYPSSPSPHRWRAYWATHRHLPLQVVMRRFDRSPPQALRAWAAERYDLVWFSTAALFEWMGRPRLGPTIVDLIDLEDDKELRRVDILRDEWRREHRRPTGRELAAVAQAEVNARDWQRFQRSVAAQADRVVLCSELEVERCGLPNASSIVTAFQRPGHPLGHDDVAAPPTLLFQGAMTYPPNVDAARWLVREVDPLLRARVADARIRLVGTPLPAVKALHRPPAVTVVGRVPDMDPELAAADVAVVPIRYGGGIRNKILESFAHRVPVVSTTVGAEGIDVEDGVHLLLADDPAAFAEACERVLTDPHLRKRLVDAGEERFLERYEWSATRRRLQDLCREVAASSRS